MEVMPFEGEVSFESIKTKKDAVDFFNTYFPNVKNEIENLTEDFFKNPTSAMVTMKCYPWTYWDKVALVGDSAHAVVPFYGQGMNAGFEDIFVLDEIIQEFGDDWEKIFLLNIQISGFLPIVGLLFLNDLMLKP